MGLENVNETKATTAINAAVIVIGSYHLPASVAFGAAVGASLFILSQNQPSPLAKAWLFAVSFSAASLVAKPPQGFLIGY